MLIEDGGRDGHFGEQVVSALSICLSALGKKPHCNKLIPGSLVGRPETNLFASQLPTQFVPQNVKQSREKILTFLERERLYALVDAPQPHAGGLVGLGHLEDDGAPLAALPAPLPLVQVAPVPGLVRVDPGRPPAHRRHQVAGGALLPGRQAGKLLV